MGRISTLDYAEMANRVYNIDGSDSSDNYRLPGYEAVIFKDQMSWGWTQTDFKGCVYVNHGLREAVAAFQGTYFRAGKDKHTKAGDLVSDIQILLGILPQYCSAALRLFERMRRAYSGYAPSLVGHSLGGGIAQVIGHWTAIPFVTFNAPGMWGDIQKAKILDWSPDGLASLEGTFKGSLLAKQMATTGRNFRNVLDPVSMIGFHYGPVTRFWGSGMHSMVDLLERVRNSRWANLNPFDAANKEWGEL
jgi:hypothetical protein